MVGLLRGALCVWAATVGSVVGAGFASGEEVLAFFAGYGDAAASAAVLAGVLIAVLGGRLMLLAQSLSASSCSSVLRLLCGPYARYAHAMLAVFWLASLAVMLSGTGVLLSAYVPPACSSVCLALVLLALSRCGTHAMLRANIVITPLVLVMLAGALVYSLAYHRASLSALLLPAVSLPSGDALMSCLVYASYDLVLCLPALVCLPRFSRGAVCFGAVLSGITLSLLLTALVAVVSLHYEDALISRLPMLMVASMQADACLALYAAVLLLAMVTSASSALVGLSRALSPYVRPPLVRDASVLLLAMLIGQAGFSVLVESVLPALGALSLVFMLRLCLPVRGGTRLR